MVGIPSVRSAIRRFGRSGDRREAGESFPPPLVRVLRNDDELRDAVARAAAFERVVAASAEMRVARYEAIEPPPGSGGRAGPSAALEPSTVSG